MVKAPRHRKAAVIFENRPRSITTSGIELVSITRRADSSPRSLGAAEGIQRVLDAITDPVSVRRLRIEDASRLESLPRLDRFANLEEIEVRSRHVRDVRELWRVRRLRRLLLADIHSDDFREFETLRLEAFRTWRGTARSSAIDVESLFLQGCSRLRTFSKSAVTQLVLERCHHVDLASLANVRGLASLSILGRDELDDVRFVARCRSLQHLTITAAPLSKVDFAPLLRHRALRAVFLAVRDRVIAAIGPRAARLVITNGSVCFDRGVLQPDAQRYFDEEAAIQEKAITRP